MAKKISASDAKNNFGGLLEDVAELGRVDIIRHGRLVAVVLSPRALEGILSKAAGAPPRGDWGAKHMIPSESARRARMIGTSSGFDEE